MNVMDRQTLLSAKPRDCPTVPWDGEDIRAEERVQRSVCNGKYGCKVLRV